MIKLYEIVKFQTISNVFYKMDWWMERVFLLLFKFIPLKLHRSSFIKEL